MLGGFELLINHKIVHAYEDEKNEAHVIVAENENGEKIHQN